MIGRFISGYLGKIRLFQGNARLCLLYLAVSSVFMGVYALLYNFYILGLGYDEALLGRLLAANSTAALIAAIPAGLASDRLGRRLALLLSGLGAAAAVAGMVVWSSPAGQLAMSGLLGVAQSLGAVTVAPFLMENSGEEERSYLFSFVFSLPMIIGMVGFWIGGRLPGWLGGADDVYRLVMLGVAVTAALALLPLLFLRPPVAQPQATEGLVGGGRTGAWHYARQNPGRLARLILPVLITAFAGALFVPFMNIFFRNQHGTGDADLGSLFAAGSLVMGLGFLAAAPLAERLGKIRLVVMTQVLFIPVMALMGFGPWFWLSAAAYLGRVVLMTMDDPIYEAFVMEQVEESARATMASLLTMATRVGWAAGPALSGWLQVNYGFSPVFLLVIGCYLLAAALTTRFFLWPRARAVAMRQVTPLS